MSILIDIPSKNCKAGATISGTVSLHGDAVIDVEIITISLVGRCKTKVSQSNGNSKIYRGRAPLLEYRQVLFKGPNTMRTNGHSWPFSFTFPTHCVARGADPFKERHGLFDVNPQQTLPPSFTSEHSVFWSGECFIRYELAAALVADRTKNPSAGDINTFKTLDFTTTRDVENVELDYIESCQQIACYSLRLLPGHEDGTLTFKEKLQSMRTSKLPVAMFKLHMLLPTAGILAHPVPLILRLEHDLEASTASSLPIVTLRKCIVTLQANTYIQCIRDELLRQGDEQKHWSNDLHVASVDYSADMAKAPPVTENMDLQKLMKIKIPRYYTPTFSTFNIRRTYSKTSFHLSAPPLQQPSESSGVNVNLFIDCAQKTFKADFRHFKFDLLPADYASPFPSSSSPPQEQEAAAPAYGDLSGHSLPTYQDAEAVPP